MNEIAWETTHSGVFDMLRHIRTQATSRKMQLLMCAACRMGLEHLPADRVLPILAGIEQYAEGLLPLEGFRQAEAAAQRLERETDGEDTTTPRYLAAKALRAAVSSPLDIALRRVLESIESVAARDAGEGLSRIARGVRHGELCNLFREIFGNPFVPRTAVPIWMNHAERSAPGWLIRVSESARAIATAMQRDQAFDRFPILADALEEEGCTDEVLLLHMRDPSQKHVRGCWALDLVLGKS